MKLLFLTEFYPQDDKLIFTGGVEARTYYIAREAKADYEVKVITSSSRHIPATPLSVLSRLWYMGKSFISALKTDFDLVEGSNVVSYLPAWMAAKLKGRPAVAWVPDVLDRHWFDFGFIVGFSGWLAEKIYLKLPWTKFIALSRATKAKLIAVGIDPHKIGVAKAGIDPKEFSHVKTNKFKQFTVICVARLVKTKRIDQLIKAVADVKPAVKLIIVGAGPLESSLKKLAGGRAAFMKNLTRKELVQILSRSHVFCLPSVVEGFGIVTIEAMACGLPAVLADIPVNREITKNGRGAVFFEPENSVDLARKITEIKKIYEPKRLEALSLAKEYSWNKIYQDTKKIYESCFHH